MKMDIRKHLWLWCHSTGCYNGQWELSGESSFTPIEAVEHMGVKNAVMVVYADEPRPPFDEYARQFKELDNVVWSIIGDTGSKRNDTESDLGYVVDLKRTIPSLGGGIMDDFFGGSRAGIDNVRRYADALHAAGLKLWVVLYGHQLDTPGLKDYLDVCDVISFWTWKAEELSLLEERLACLRNMAPNKEIALGCYMWDFGNSGPIRGDDMKYQFDFAFEKWRRNEISDIVILGSPLIGMDVEAVEWSRNWIKSLP